MSKQSLSLFILTLLLTLWGCGDEAPPRVEACDLLIYFQESPEGLSPQDLSIVGNFNDWREGKDHLKHIGEGLWAAWLSPGPGHWYYRLVDEQGESHLDPSNPLTHYAEDGLESSYYNAQRCFERALIVDQVEVSAEGIATIQLSLGPYPPNEDLQLGASLRGGGSVEVARNEAGWVVTTTPLPDGKHRINLALWELDALMDLGDFEPTVTIPFWVEDRPFEWEDATIYQVVVDRFRSSEGPAAQGESISYYFGGDLWGLTAALEEGYFDALGVNALWLSPLYENPEGRFRGRDGRLAEAYHGYWAAEPRQVEERFGGEDALDALIEAAHARGVRVMMDFVPNHLHKEHPYWNAHPDESWFNHPEADCICGMTCAWEAFMNTCWFDPFLPDLNWENREVAETILADAVWWVDRFDLDGLRIDAVPMMPRLVVRHLRHEMSQAFEHPGSPSIYLLGETYTARGEQALIDHYTGHEALTGQFDFPTMWALREALSLEASFSSLDMELQHSERTWGEKPGVVMAPFLGNHDVPRFLSSVNGDDVWNPRDNPPPTPETRRPYDLLMLGWTFLLAQPGAPILYYGDEIGMPGGYDPDNRRAMRFSGLAEIEAEILAHVQRLGQLRRCSESLKRGTRKTLKIDGDVYTWGRFLGTGDVAIVAINRSGTTRNTSLKLPAEWPTAGYHSALEGEFTLEEGVLNLTLPAYGSLLLLTEEACLNQTP